MISGCSVPIPPPPRRLLIIFVSSASRGGELAPRPSRCQGSPLRCMGDRSLGLPQTAASRRSPSPPLGVGGAGSTGSFPSPAAAAAASHSSSCPFSPAVTGSSGSGGVSGGSPPPSLFPLAAAAAHHQTMQDELLLGVTQQQQPGSERLGSSPASGHPPLGHPSSDFKPSLSPHQDLNKQQPQQQQPPPPQLSQKRKEFKQQQLSSPAQLGSSHPLNNHHPPDYHHHPPQQQQQQFSHPTDKYQQQEHRLQQQFQLLSAHPPEPPRTEDYPHLRPLSPAEHKGGADSGGSERLAPSCPGGSVSADPNVGVAAASCVNPPPSPPHLQARAKLPPMESPPNSHLLGSPGNLLPGGLGSGFSSLQSPEIPSPHHQSGGGSSSAASPPPPPLPGFGTPWSVQTSSPPPQQTQQPPVSSGSGGGQISAMPPPSPESETSFYPGIPSSINPAFFQSFSPVSPHNPCAGPFSSPFSAAAPPPPPQMNLPQQQQQQQNRRSPVSPQLQHQHQAAAAAAAFLQQRNSYNHHQVPGGGGRAGQPRRGGREPGRDGSGREPGAERGTPGEREPRGGERAGRRTQGRKRFSAPRVSLVEAAGRFPSSRCRRPATLRGGDSPARPRRQGGARPLQPAALGELTAGGRSPAPHGRCWQAVGLGPRGRWQRPAPRSAGAPRPFRVAGGVAAASPGL